MCLSVGDYLKKSSARVIVLLVFLEMVCQFLNSFAQNGNLNLGRPSVGVVNFDVLNNSLFLCLGKHKKPNRSIKDLILQHFR